MRGIRGIERMWRMPVAAVGLCVIAVSSAAGADTAVPVTVVEVTEPSAFSVPGPTFRRRLTLNYDAKAAAGLHLEVQSSDLSSADGTSAKVTVSLASARDGGKKDVPLSVPAPTPPVDILLTATIPHVGDYSGILRFKLGAPPNPSTKAYRVTRAMPVALPINVNALHTVDTDWCFQLTGIKTLHTVNFTVEGLSDREVQVTPELFELAKLDEAGTKRNANTVGRNFKLNSYVSEPGAAASIPQGKPQNVTLNIISLAPGVYTGKLRLYADEFLPKEVTFSVSSRLPWVIAALVIVLGAGGSVWLNRLGAEVRPALVVRASVARLMHQLEGAKQQRVLDDIEEGVLADIFTRLVGIRDDALSSSEKPTGWPAAMQTKLGAEGGKVFAFASWVNAKRLLDSITTLDTVTRDTFKKRLDAVRGALSADEALPTATQRDVATLHGDIAQARDNAARAATAAAAQRVQDAAAASSDPDAKREFAVAEARTGQAAELLKLRDFKGYLMAQKDAGLAYYRGVVRNLQAATAREPADAQGKVDLTGGASPRVRPVSQEAVNQVLLAPDVISARLAYESAVASVRPPGAGLLRVNVLEAHGSTSGVFPDPGVMPQGPLLAPLRDTTIEDSALLNARAQRLSVLVDVVSVAAAALLGVLVVWAPNAGWGDPVDLFAALLWGLGLHTIGTSAFNIMNFRAQLVPRV